MKKVDRISGQMLPIPRSGVDTDQILPAQFLKRVERHGFGNCLFYEWARDDPQFVLNRPQYARARILVAGQNFGVGSSREHAAWAIQDWGLEAVIAPSFGDIFFSNCINVGLLPVVLPEEAVEALLIAAIEDPETHCLISLADQTVQALGHRYEFGLDRASRQRLLDGIDTIDLALQNLDLIDAHEANRPSYRPSLG